MTQIKWQNPPAAYSDMNKRYFSAAVRAALRAKPRKWALVHNSHHSANAAQWQKKYGREGFEVVCRTVKGSDPKRYDIYARFVPEAVSA